MSKKRAAKISGSILLLVLIVVAILFIASKPFNYEAYVNPKEAVATIILPAPFRVTHLPTPEPVKALYMSSWAAGNSKLRSTLVKLIDETELNAVVIDIKDYTGRISFNVENPELKKYGSVENRVPDMKEFIGLLHKKGIYVIGRISVFQDSFLVKTHPEYAVKNKAGQVWRDFKGVSWLDAGAQPVWDYIVAIGEEAYAQGFDELNFDYIRFPSDGNMLDIVFPYSHNRIKSEVLKEFFAHLDQTFRPKKIPISADLFGMTTSNYDDLGIGQILEGALIHFDYVAPMVYPSHYPPNFNGLKNPAEKPYEVIYYAMSKGVERAKLVNVSPLKLRPWLQDFSIGGVEYTPQMVKDQVKATYDVGLSSWMVWNASNVYTQEAYEKVDAVKTY